MIPQLDQRIRRALSTIRNAFRGRIRRVNSAVPVQLVQLDALAGEQLQAAELMQHYGYTSNPPADTMAVVLPIGGKTAHGIIIATEHGSYRLQMLKPGEVALYTDEGDNITLKQGRITEINTQHLIINASSDVHINTPNYTCTAQQITQDAPQLTHTGTTALNNGFTAQGGSGRAGYITGTLEATVDLIAAGKSGAHHRHNEHDAGVTGEPV